MNFFKTSTFGNDFLCVEAREPETKGSGRGDLAKAICRRHGGVGADGVVFFRAGKKETDFQVFNRDGTEAELSGNGMAGLASVLFYQEDFDREVILSTRVGKRKIVLMKRKGVQFLLRGEIGVADFDDRRLFPFRKGKWRSSIHEGIEFFPVSVGNPHAVVVMKKLPPPEKLVVLGKKLEGAPLFPTRTNVEFVTLGDEGRCQVFFYERGVGPTMASSTGSAAVFAVLRRNGMVGERLAISTRAGEIAVSGTETIFIDAVTRLVCRGEYFL